MTRTDLQPGTEASTSATATAVASEARGRVPVDVMILTYNEEANLPHALRSVVPWANRVFVVDSGSTDRTRDIAREMGAEVVEHAWEGYARQKNWAIDHLPFGSPWVFILDADEAITPELRDEISRLCSRPPEQVPQSGFYVNRYLVFMGKRIRHCGYFPSWNLRLFKRGAARYEDRPVHEHMVLKGQDGALKGLMSHEDRRGLEYYIAKHNRYSTLEAETIFYAHDDQPGGADGTVRPRLFGNAVERRRFVRAWVYRKLPARWLGRFVWMYFMNLGFLDGAAGLRFCLLISSHELYTTLKLRELQQRAREAARGGGGSREPSPTTQRQLDDQLIRASATTPAAGGASGGNNGPAVAPAAGSGAKGSAGVSGASDPQVDPIHAHRKGPDVPASPDMDPEHLTALRNRSPWSFKEKVMRVLWMVVRATLFRWSFHNWYGARRVILRGFGARIARGVRIRPTAQIEIPWNLDLGPDSAVGDWAILYSLGKITIGRRCVVSQYAHLCAGTHDYTRHTFPLLTPPITLQDDVWVAAEAFVGPGVTVGERSVVGARSTVVKDVPPGVVVAGNPAKVVKPRVLNG